MITCLRITVGPAVVSLKSGISGDLSGIITIPLTAFRHGLSGWALFTGPHTGVPDGGATVMLLGAGLGALGVVRRYLTR